MELRIAQLPWDMEDVDGSRQAHLEDANNYSNVPWKLKLKPSKGHAVPFVTGYRYHIHWQTPQDFKKMKVEVSERWQPKDLPVFFSFNYTDTREAITVIAGYGAGEEVPEGTLPLDIAQDVAQTSPTSDAPSPWKSGDNAFNHNYGNEFEFVVNGADPARTELLFEGKVCIVDGHIPNEEGVCGPPPEIDEGAVVETEPRYWSHPDSWTDEEGVTGVVPGEGADVEIKPTWNMVLDVPDPPLLNSLKINGRLSFLQDDTRPMDITLQARNIWVQAGQFDIGSQGKPFTNIAKITLVGE